MILTPTQNDLDLFAELSGDANPIHVDPAFAKRSGFGRPVAHGAMLTAWLVRAAGLEGSPQATSAMFPAPAFAGEDLTVVREAEALELQRLMDGVVVCRLNINGPISGENAASAPCCSGVPLKVGMTATHDAFIGPDVLLAMQGLQARASQADISPDIAENLAGQACILGLVSTVLGMDLPGQGTNYLKQEMFWLGALKPGQNVHAKVVVTRIRPEKALVDLSTHVSNEDGEVLARGRALVSARDVKDAF